MALNAQFSLALELSNILPVRAVVESAAAQVLKFARDLRKSGSDIVVEEDLAGVFGRGIINPELERTFRDAVKVQSFVPLSCGSEIRLDSGPGPTMFRALKDQRYFATVIQLSLLAWIQSRDELSQMLAKCMKERLEMGIPDASNPGIDGIIKTLAACNSQTSNFAWNFYIQQVEVALRGGLPNYRFHHDYIRMTENLLLCAIDYLYLVQRLPDQRKVLVSNQVGSITLIVWAHYVLGLTVVVTTIKMPHKRVAFGTSEEPQVIIHWQNCGDHSADADPHANYVSGCQKSAPEVRLLDQDMSVVLQALPDETPSQIASYCRDRHPLLGYGRVSLYRMFNSNKITPDNDPIYEDTVRLVTALAINVSSKLGRRLNPDSREEERIRSLPRHEIQIEVWRLMAAANVIFSGIKQYPQGVATYVEYLADSKFDHANVPANFMKHLKAATQQDASLPLQHVFVSQIRYLAGIVLLFSCVIDVESCAEMPIILRCPFHTLEGDIDVICRNPNARPTIPPETIFHGVVQLLCDDAHRGDYIYPREDTESLFLRCDFGWSVFLDTVGEKDPAEVNPHFVHIRKGVPTNAKTNERRLEIGDGGFNFGPGYNTPKTYRVPPTVSGLLIRRSVAKVIRHREFWTIRAHRFEMGRILTVEPVVGSELHQLDAPRMEVVTACKSMFWQIWEAFLTPPCSHQPEATPEGPLNLGPDAIALLGWSCAGESMEGCHPYPQRVLVFLTRNDAYIRWLAIKNAVDQPGAVELSDRREVMLRTTHCCDRCALEHVFSLSGKWTLIL